MGAGAVSGRAPSGILSAADRPLFLVWAERHRGTRSAWLAEALGIDDLRYVSPTSKRRLAGAWRKYPVQLAASLVTLARRRPRTVFVQSPPSFTAWVAWFYAVMTGAAYVIDAHSDAFERSIWTRPSWLTTLVARRAIATIVTNEHWAGIVRSRGGRAICVPSIPTTFPVGASPPLADGQNVAVVNTWAHDEPLDAVLDAAARLPEVTFHVTGRASRVPQLGRAIPPNVRFTDFLAEDAYHALLRSADAVVCLTTRDHTMQNGACEALSHGTPIITSDWEVLRTYFSSGTAHVDNSAEGIAAGIRRVLDDVPGHRAAIAALRDQRLREWHDQRVALVDLIHDHRAGRTRRRADDSPEEPS